MRHRYFGRKLSRTKNERRRLFQILVRDVFAHGRITTTLAKAKAVQPILEQLITKAKRATDSDRVQIEKVIADNIIERKILAEAKTRFANRANGFTQIIKLGTRKGDNAEMVILQFVDVVTETEVIKPKNITSKQSDKPTVTEKKTTKAAKPTKAVKPTKTKKAVSKKK